MKIKSGCVLVDLDGTQLTAEELELLAHPQVAGILLFARNYSDPQQLKQLINAIWAVRPLPMFVDQEGGRVQRFKKDFTAIDDPRSFGTLYDEDPRKAKQTLAEQTGILVQELQACQVFASLVPVLDLDYGVSSVNRGGRTYHSDPQIIIELAQVVIETMHRLGMPVTGKHFPGHGAVSADSHEQLPVDARDWDTLGKHDLLPFQALVTHLDAIMPAHVVYPQIDHLPPCFSHHWLQSILRKQMGFNGVIMTDDLSMGGAQGMGDYAERALRAVEVGCDLLLVCNNRQGAIATLEALENHQDEHSQMRLQEFMRGHING